MLRQVLMFCGGASLLMSFTAAEAQVIYDFSAQAGTHHHAFKEAVTQASVPAVNDVPSTDFEAADYGAVGFSDNNRQVSVPGVSTHAATRFVFTLDEPRTPKSMKILWQGRTQSSGLAKLYLWDVSTAGYKHIDDTNSSLSDEVLATTTTTPANYIDSDQRVTVLIYNAVVGKSISTNYVRLSISQCLIDEDCDDRNPCTDDSCLSDVCNYATNSAPCDDGDACTVGDACFDGACGSGTPADCSRAGDQCNSAACDRGGVEGNCDVRIPFENGTTCDDANPCSLDETCQSGECVGGGTVDCSGFGDACNPASCDPAGANGNCDIFGLAPDGTSCDDGHFCTVPDVCVSGVCVGGASPCDRACDESTQSCVECADAFDCDDGIACTIDDCDTGRCTHNPDDGACGDAIFCDGREFCDASSGCVSPGNPCAKNEFCNEDADSCDQCQADADCDDGNPCTLGEACVAGQCQPGDEYECTAFDEQCLKASCDPAGAPGNCDDRVQVVDGAPCDDGEACTSDDACHSGSCSGVVLYGLTEWSNLANCLGGPELKAADGCSCSDYNADGRIDLLDVAQFMLQFAR